MARTIALLVAAATLAAPLGAAPPLKLSIADTAAAFKAAGFVRRAGKWQGCGDPGTGGYTPGAIEWVRDVNGDGLPEVLINETSTYCYGMTGTGFSLVGKTRAGTWRLILANQGMAELLATKGLNNWPDISVGGPGFCFPVYRWNGKSYLQHRFEYEGKRCRPNR
jgi:hypothetical protein